MADDVRTENRVAVIGAGPAGLAAAYSLSRLGMGADVYEAGDAVGGMSRTFPLWDQRVDLGPHRFFSNDKRVNDLWFETLGEDFRLIDRQTRILFREQLFDYPLRPLGTLAKLGLPEACRCILSYLKTRALPPPPGEDLERWLVSRFGRRLCDLFFRGYSEKLWGLPCALIHCDFAQQRIQNFSLSAAIADAFRIKGRGKGRIKHRTIVDRFAYPKFGTGSVYERMARKAAAAGARIFLSSPIDRVQIESGEAVGVTLQNGESRRHSAVVSSMPITQLIGTLGQVPEEVRAATSSLRFRSTILVYLRIPAIGAFPDQWLYIQSPNLRMGRLTNYRNWSPELYGSSSDTILSAEYWCFEGDDLWSRGDGEISGLAVEELARSGLPGIPEPTGVKVIRLRNSYPVYDLDYRKRVAVVREFLRSIKGLTCIGRYGAFKYNNQDHSILMGILAAENLAMGASHDLWKVNTDYDRYIESALPPDVIAVARAVEPKRGREGR